MKKFLSLTLAAAMLLSMLAGCGNTASDDTTSDDTSANVSTDTAGNTVTGDVSTSVDSSEEPDGVVAGSTATVVVISDYVSTQLPGIAGGCEWMNVMLYDHLFTSASGQWDDLAPSIVDTYTISEDGLTYTFTIHDNIYFTNGKQMTAQSILDCFAYHEDIGNNGPLTSMESGVATGDFEFVMVLNSYNPELFVQMAAQNFAMFDSSAYWELGSTVDAAYMAGSGPYYVSDYAIGSYIEYTAKEDHWDESRQAHIETVTGLVVTDTSTQMTIMQAEEADFLVITDADMFDVLSNYDFLGFVSDEAGMRPLWVNTGDSRYCEYLDNVRVREALSLMIDQEELALATGGEYAEVGPNAMNTTLSYEWDRAYDPDLALEILAEEGVDPNDITLVALCASTNTTMLTNLQSQLAQYGVTLEFTVQDNAAVNSAGMAGTWDIWVDGGTSIGGYYNAFYNSMGASASKKCVTDAEWGPVIADYVAAAFNTQSESVMHENLNNILQVLDEQYLCLASVVAPQWYVVNEDIMNFEYDSGKGYWMTWESWMA